MRRAISVAAAIGALAFCSGLRAQSQEATKPVSDRQIAVMMFVDYGRSYGYQTLLASIQIDVVKAQIERDTALLAQKEKLFAQKAIPLIEVEIARLKDLWNRKQLVVAEKSLATVSAQYAAMGEMAKHFGGVTVSTASRGRTTSSAQRVSTAAGRCCFLI